MAGLEKFPGDDLIDFQMRIYRYTISSGRHVSFSQPLSVIARVFSIPTAPLPGNRNFGSTAIVWPASRRVLNFGARTGSSSSSSPTPCPSELCQFAGTSHKMLPYACIRRHLCSAMEEIFADTAGCEVIFE